MSEYLIILIWSNIEEFGRMLLQLFYSHELFSPSGLSLGEIFYVGLTIVMKNMIISNKYNY